MEKYVPREIAKERATLSLPECVARADELIEKNGICLMLMDIIGSRRFFHDSQFRRDFSVLISDLSYLFEEYLPEHSLIVADRPEQGFNIVLGDGVAAGINSSTVIPLVAEYTETFYPHIPFRYGVAEDGWDKPNIALLK